MVVKGDLVDKISSSIAKVLPRLYNKELVFLNRVITKDSFGAEKFTFTEARTLPGLVIAKGATGGFTAEIAGDKEWKNAEFIAYCLTPELPKLLDKIRIEGLGELSITNIQSFENVLTIGLSEEL